MSEHDEGKANKNHRNTISKEERVTLPDTTKEEKERDNIDSVINEDDYDMGQGDVLEKRNIKDPRDGAENILFDCNNLREKINFPEKPEENFNDMFANNSLAETKTLISATSHTKSLCDIMTHSLTDSIICQNYSSKPATEFVEECKSNLNLLHAINKDMSLRGKFKKRLKEKILNRGSDLSSDAILLYIIGKLCSEADKENICKANVVEQHLQQWMLEVIFDLKNEIEILDDNTPIPFQADNVSNIHGGAFIHYDELSSYLQYDSEQDHEGIFRHQKRERSIADIGIDKISKTSFYRKDNENIEASSLDECVNMNLPRIFYHNDVTNCFAKLKPSHFQEIKDNAYFNLDSNDCMEFSHPLKPNSKGLMQQDNEETVTLKIVTKERIPLFTNSYKVSCSLFDVKENVSRALPIHKENISLWCDDVELTDEITLFDLYEHPRGIVELTLQTSEVLPLGQSFINQEYPENDVITVRLGKRDGSDEASVKDVVVEIERARVKKAFLGGFRDKRTGAEYHNACSQTLPLSSLHPPQNKVNRRIQTVRQSTKIHNTCVTKGIQVNKGSCKIPSVSDTFITSFQNATDFKTKSNIEKVCAVITIQRYVRGWLARKLAKEMEMQRRKTVSPRKNDTQAHVQKNECPHPKILSREVRPVTKTDIEIFYALIERWRRAEICRISEVSTKVSQKALFCALLEKEIKMLSQIEKLRCRIREEERRKSDRTVLEIASQPTTWRSYKEIKVSMETIRVQRAKELRKLYNSIFQENKSLEERLELLISLKYALKKHDSARVPELARLIDRECELSARGLGRQLDMLRERIRTLFVAFIREAYSSSEANTNSTTN